MQRAGRHHRVGLGAAALGMALVVAAGGAIAWSSGQARADDGIAETVLTSTTGAMVGQVTLTQVGGAVRVDATVQGLPPGFHGFHIHAVGQCDAAAGFTSAGGHVNPGDHHHAEHAGDQPSLYVMADGTGTLSFLTDRYSIDELLGGEPRALIVHALPDNFANIPVRYAPDGPDGTTHATGDAGGRIACGVITGPAQ